MEGEYHSLLAAIVVKLVVSFAIYTRAWHGFLKTAVRRYVTQAMYVCVHTITINFFFFLAPLCVCCHIYLSSYQILYTSYYYNKQHSFIILCHYTIFSTLIN